VFGAQVGERVRAGLQVLGGLLVECGVPAADAAARALDAYIQIEGAMVLTRTLDDMQVFRAVIRRLPAELLRGTPHASPVLPVPTAPIDIEPAADAVAV
jgi:hypothetical protein